MPQNVPKNTATKITVTGASDPITSVPESSEFTFIVKVKAGSSVTIGNIPAGTKYAISERTAKGSHTAADGTVYEGEYTVAYESNKSSGTIDTNGNTQTVTATNTLYLKEDAIVKVKKSVVTSMNKDKSVAAADDKFEFVLKKWDNGVATDQVGSSVEIGNGQTGTFERLTYDDLNTLKDSSSKTRDDWYVIQENMTPEQASKYTKSADIYVKVHSVYANGVITRTVTYHNSPATDSPALQVGAAPFVNTRYAVVLEAAKAFKRSVTVSGTENTVDDSKNAEHEDETFTFKLYKLPNGDGSETHLDTQTLTYNPGSANNKVEFNYDFCDTRLTKSGEAQWYRIEEDLGENEKKYTSSGPVYAKVTFENQNGAYVPHVEYFADPEGQKPLVDSTITNTQFRAQFEVTKAFAKITDNVLQNTNADNDEKFDISLYNYDASVQDGKGTFIGTKMVSEDGWKISGIPTGM